MTHTRLETSDPVFEVVSGQRRQVFKVRHGLVVVSAVGGAENAVVVGRDHQTTVPTGERPASPVKTKRLTASEKSKLDKLAQVVPPGPTGAPPKPLVTGPPDPSSLRTAVFAFTATTPGAVFSCAFDGTDFRLCTSPQTFERVGPGRHTFTVKATDQAGNIGTTSHSWTVDSSMIAFTSKRSGDGQIYVMDPEADGGVTRLTNSGGPNWDPEWSPDRRRIVFHSDRDGNSEIYVMNANGSDQRRLTNNEWADRNPTWSPDGRQIAFQRIEGTSDIYVMNADGTGERRVTADPADDIDPAWSPDGTQIAFASTRGWSTFQIHVMNLAGASQRLAYSPGKDFNPAWSPNGRKLAFHSNRDGVSSKIYLMNPDGTNQVALTTTAADRFQSGVGAGRTGARLPEASRARTPLWTGSALRRQREWAGFYPGSPTEAATTSSRTGRSEGPLTRALVPRPTVPEHSVGCHHPAGHLAHSSGDGTRA